MRIPCLIAALGALSSAAPAVAQSSTPFQQFNIGRPTQQEAVGAGSDALKMLGVQPPSDPMKRLEAPRGNSSAGQAPAATPAAQTPQAGECRARAQITGWRWTEDGRRPVALGFSVESDQATRPRAIAVDFVFEYRGADAAGKALDEPLKSYVSTEIMRLAAGENPAQRNIETGPTLIGRTVMERIVVGSVACRAE
jgi:hypothetical protein